MAIGAEDLAAHGAAIRCAASFIQHGRQQAGLRQRLLRACITGWLDVARGGELGNHIQRIARRNRPQRQISVDRIGNLAGAGAVAAQAILILIDRRIDDGRARPTR